MAVDPGGYNVPRFEERRADEVVPEWQSRFGAGSNVASSTDDGLLIDELTAFLQAVDQKGSLAYNAGFFNSATGLNIDNLIGGLFGSIRAPDRGSIGPVVLYGDDGTIVSPANDPSEVSTPRGDVYSVAGPTTLVFSNLAVFIFGPAFGGVTTTTITLGGTAYGPTTDVIGTGFQVAQNMHAALPSSGDVNILSVNDIYEDPAGNGVLVLTLTGLLNSTVAATASQVAQSRGVEADATSIEPGAIPGQEGQLNTINTPISGWLGAVNLEDVTPGAAEDTDAQYRQRHLDTLGKGGTSTLIAMLSILRDITRNPGVEYVQIFQNLEPVIVDGRPGRSFEVVIEGGAELTIVTLIWENHPLGIQTFGSTSVAIEDSRAAGQHLISYSRPMLRHVWVDVVITPGEGFPSTDTSDIQNQVSIELAAFGVTLGIGRDVYIDELKQQISLSGTQSIVITLGATALATDPKPALFPANLDVLERELTVWDVGKIEVTVL